MDLHHSHGFFQLPEQYELGGDTVKDECFAESSGNLAESSDNFKHEDVDYLLDEPYPSVLDEPHSSVLDDLALNEESFLEANDLLNPVETDPIGFDLLEEYLTFFDADDDNLQLSFDPTEILGSEEPISGQTIPDEVNYYGSEQKGNGVAENEFMATKQTSVASINDASTSKQNFKAIDTSSGRILYIKIRS